MTTSYNSNPAGIPDPSVRVGNESWMRNFPNPAKNQTTIELRLPRASGPIKVDLAVYDIQGRKIANLFSGRIPGGSPYTFQWDGTDDHGKRVASGVYFSRAVINGESQNRKMLMIR